jgi:hypothetical protein
MGVLFEAQPEKGNMFPAFSCPIVLARTGFFAVAQQCNERHIYLSPATLVIVPNTMLVPHWRQQILVSTDTSYTL